MPYLVLLLKRLFSKFLSLLGDLIIFVLSVPILIVDYLLDITIKIFPEQYHFFCMLINFLPLYEELIYLVVDFYWFHMAIMLKKFAVIHINPIINPYPNLKKFLYWLFPKCI
jgi:hypothetical protein